MVALMLLGTASTLRAQSSLAQSTGEPAAPNADDSAAIVFVLPPLDAQSAEQLRDALLAQFALVDAQLLLRDEEAAQAGAPMHVRMASAQELASEHHALAVLWLEAEPLGRWFVHVLDARHERVVVRRVDARDAQRPAAIEAVAVMAREAARAVIAGDPAPSDEASTVAAPRSRASEPAPAAEPTPAASEPPPAPPEPSSTHSRSLGARLSLGYVGSDFASNAAFSHGVGLSARAQLFGSVYLGLGVALTGAVEPADADGLAIYRIPGQLFGGYRAPLASQLFADLELGLLLEALRREAGAATATPDTTRFLAGLSPRVRFEWRPWPPIGLYVGGGVDLLVTNLRYEALDPARAVLLRPSWVRPALEAGIAFHP
jgi:hypothetical protein